MQNRSFGVQRSPDLNPPQIEPERDVPPAGQSWALQLSHREVGGVLGQQETHPKKKASRPKMTDQPVAIFRGACCLASRLGIPVDAIV
jgi:hypothetical protein